VHRHNSATLQVYLGTPDWGNNAFVHIYPKTSCAYKTFQNVHDHVDISSGRVDEDRRVVSIKYVTVAI
jgi:hypothetical protein